MTRRMLCWEDVSEGMEIPPISLELTMRRMMMAVCGTRDLYPLHHDRDFARAMGQKDMVPNILFLGAFLGRCLTDWTGPTGKIRKLSVVAGTPSYPGETITASGRVTKKYVSDGDHKIDCHLVVTKADASTIVNCRATVIIPSKGR
jgi:acyl dehydratase